MGPQLGRNIKAYMDDIVVKSRRRDSLVGDLQETFNNLRRIKLKLNPEKCTFGVDSGNLLGFLVSHGGIEGNPQKIEAIEKMEAPRKVRDVQRLNGCVAALGRLISRLGERALPFFKVMKKKGPINWTPEAEAAFQDLKRYLKSPLVLVAPKPGEPFLLCLAATDQVVSSVLVAERKEQVSRAETEGPGAPGELKEPPATTSALGSEG